MNYVLFFTYADLSCNVFSVYVNHYFQQKIFILFVVLLRFFNLLLYCSNILQSDYHKLYAIQLIAPFLLVKYFSCGLVSLPWFLLSYFFLYICFLVYYVHTCIHACDLNLLYLQCFLLLESNESRWSEFLQETDGSHTFG